MPKFRIVSDFKPTGDQPQAIDKLVQGIQNGLKHQVLLGVTGSGKTFSMANVIEKVQKPTLVISHNKTLAGQLAQEFKSILPNNAVEYFVSYYDYYQPEAYIPGSDTYIEKETQINEEIEKLRLATTASLLTRKDVVVVASVSAIYNLGSPVEYGQAVLEIKAGMKTSFAAVLKILTKMYYLRNDIDFHRGTFRVKGDTIDVFPAYMDQGYRLQFLGDRVERVSILDPLTGQISPVTDTQVVYPAKHYVTPEDRLQPALKQIEADLEARLKDLRSQNKLVEAQRLEQRTNYDLEMIKEFGYCNGIENYSRYFDGRQEGDPPYTLLDYFPDDFLIILDESHMTIPQIRGMYNGDRSRKQTLIEFGFRLPSALDNRPLRFDEFMRKVNQAIYTSATPDEYELSLAGKNGVAEQLVRPTGILDPEIEIRPSEGQIMNLMGEIEARVARHERTLITTLTKRTAEDLSDFLKERGIKVNYLHSEVETLARSDILQSLRMGEVDAIVGINLLREGLDLPEVSLVVILDADKEGFLRSRTSLIQTMGRAARHIEGKVIMYADNITGSMQAAIDEVKRRRKYQAEYNKKHHITPKAIVKPLRDRLIEKIEEEKGEKVLTVEDIPASEKQRIIKHLEEQMKEAAEALDFEEAAKLRDQIKELGI
ncbi:excinuclease ABC subunit UvrB [Candidatus Daviesbacteria bacterium]|nr:excinuclease ABC subunit UvrB [Candidatus Daviesbacteria bacterium]